MCTGMPAAASFWHGDGAMGVALGVVSRCQVGFALGFFQVAEPFGTAKCQHFHNHNQLKSFLLYKICYILKYL